MHWVIECTHSMILADESTHSTAQPLNVHNDLPIECTHSVA